MKLTFKLNGNNFDCLIGYSLLTAASQKIKEMRMESFRATIEILAQQGNAVDTKESIKRVLEEHIFTQIPTDDEVRAWLGTLDGQVFSLVHGTKRLPTKLTEDLAYQAMDEMCEEDRDRLINSIAELCFGAKLAEIGKESSQKALELAKAKLEIEKIEVEELQLALKAKRDKAATISAQDAGTETAQ